MVEHRGRSFLVLADEDVGWRLISQRRYEEDELDALLACVDPTDLCIDVGANFGLYTVHLASHVPSGRVIAFEPLSTYRAFIAFNARINGLSNVQIDDRAVASGPGTRKINVPEDGGFTSLMGTGRQEGKQTQNVETVSLDDALKGTQDRIGALKIDVEGAEREVLQGAERLLSDPERRPKAVLVELAPENLEAIGSGPEEIVAPLLENAYEPMSFREDGIVHGIDTRRSENVLFVSERYAGRLRKSVVEPGGGRRR